MKCPKCYEEYSRTVLKIHVSRCKGLEDLEIEEPATEDLEESEIREKAKDLGIKSSHNKKIETLLEEIAAEEAKLVE